MYQLSDALVIKDEELDLFKSFLEEKQELCGAFEIVSGELIPVNINVGQTVSYPGGTREMCLNPDSYYIWHTHPYISFAVPSTEDIMHVVKHREIYSSIVIGAWGIWEIYKVKNVYSDAYQTPTQEVQKIVDGLIEKTRIPRTQRINNYKNRMDIDNFKKDIHSSVNKLNRILDSVKICFTSWDLSSR